MCLPEADRMIFEKCIENTFALTKVKMSLAYVLRQGARMFCRKQNLFLHKVRQGQYHAKKRKLNQ